MEQKVSLITTVKNEEKSIKAFLDSVVNQTRKPDEVIIVDGGSRDDTVFQITSFKAKFPIILITKEGNRSVGRNTAIKKAKNSIIAVSDVGCTLDRHWLKHITQPFQNEQIDVVGGFYRPVTHSVFEASLATYTCTMEDKLDRQNFLPSSRSIAFRKKAWKQVRGYPEHLDTCEDLIFDKRLKNKGLTFYTEDKAIVYWPQRKNIFKATKQFYLYAVGDGRAHYFRLNTYLLFTRYILGVVFLSYILLSHKYSLFLLVGILFLFYLFWAVNKNYRYVKKNQAFFLLPVLQITSDLSVLSGTIVGIVLSIWDTQDKQ